VATEHLWLCISSYRKNCQIQEARLMKTHI